jgi:23S rRNA (adenine2503-C2)-methyltransferase
MRIIEKSGDSTLASVYIAQFRDDPAMLVEFVDARDPDLPKEDKWVIIVSSQFGCPVACPMCDAGGEYFGNLTTDEIFAQIDHVVERENHERLRSSKFKIQFARMGEPSLNPSVLEVLRELPIRYNAPGLIPCVATVAPRVAREWFDELLAIRSDIFKDKLFQLQLSINSTDEITRNRLMPIAKMDFRQLSDYCDTFFRGGPRKVALNFALSDVSNVEPKVIRNFFSPDSCCIKITPLNPTIMSQKEGLATAIDPAHPERAGDLVDSFRTLGYDVILSIGDVRENHIGSNCGMSVRKFKNTIIS